MALGTTAVSGGDDSARMGLGEELQRRRGSSEWGRGNRGFGASPWHAWGVEAARLKQEVARHRRRARHTPVCPPGRRKTTGEGCWAGPIVLGRQAGQVSAR